MKKKIDAINHIFVPKHIKLTEKEAKEFLKKLNIALDQLPKIPKKDPAIVSLEPQPGDIIKILRDSPTAGKTIYYRVVTNG
ncbi:DNA-directed RNA polymerase subunit H [archaeon]|nr:DNA-directed RNA polymerase subunit H [archaeon]|tara:strand:+ start:262 stop:504 length:243 start_codon:yes stop_codon:yes gene_type:complete